MAIETKLIPTQTIITVDTDGNTIDIFTFYNDGLAPFTILAFIASEDATINDTLIEQGDLVIHMINSPEFIDYFLDSSGNLIVLGDDADNYSIDGDGNLIYTTS